MINLDDPLSVLTNNKNSKEDLLRYLTRLKELESKLWGVTLNDIAASEEMILESSNHLIFLLNNTTEKQMKSILALKEVKEFFYELKRLNEDFMYLKKKIKDKNKLKNYISKYTIKLVDQRRYDKMKNIFILEKQLYDVLDIQDMEFKKLMKEIKEIQYTDNDEKISDFMNHLYRVRDILAGHMDHHQLWEEELQGYSNTSNILTKLIKEVNSTF